MSRSGSCGKHIFAHLTNFLQTTLCDAICDDAPLQYQCGARRAVGALPLNCDDDSSVDVAGVVLHAMQVMSLMLT